MYYAYYKEIGYKLDLIDEHRDLHEVSMFMTYIQITCGNFIKKDDNLFGRIQGLLAKKIHKYWFNPALKKILESPLVGYENCPGIFKLKEEIPAVL